MNKLNKLKSRKDFLNSSQPCFQKTPFSLDPFWLKLKDSFPWALDVIYLDQVGMDWIKWLLLLQPGKRIRRLRRGLSISLTGVPSTSIEKKSERFIEGKTLEASPSEISNYQVVVKYLQRNLLVLHHRYQESLRTLFPHSVFEPR